MGKEIDIVGKIFFLKKILWIVSTFSEINLEKKIPKWDFLKIDLHLFPSVISDGNFPPVYS